MPKAAASPYDDHDGRSYGAVAGALGVVRRRPIDALAGLVAAAGVVTILVNALALQQGRHPAPLFRDAAPRPVTTAPAQTPLPARDALVADIQEALIARGYLDGPADGMFGAKTATAISAFEEAHRLPSTGAVSERLLATVLSAPAKPKAQPSPSQPAQTPAAAPRPAPATTGSVASASKLMAVQRALAKLGYGPVAIDGKMGAATRAAISGFERDRRLPVTGEPNAQTVKALQTVSGMTIE
ncbi:peptidoglycan-binding protein [Methylopila musalis]|uniref:Peptidoglycan-binding protein n=1 Tax=Methylopila musalis TaxID=1134781 RepID=A0ABW3ZBU5_9HYPH